MGSAAGPSSSPATGLHSAFGSTGAATMAAAIACRCAIAEAVAHVDFAQTEPTLTELNPNGDRGTSCGTPWHVSTTSPSQAEANTLEQEARWPSLPALLSASHFRAHWKDVRAESRATPTPASDRHVQSNPLRFGRNERRFGQARPASGGARLNWAPRVHCQT